MIILENVDLTYNFIISGEECFCRDWHGCIMQQSIVGMENIQPYKFSECSLNDYIDAFRDTRNMCLLNKPNEVQIHYLSIVLYISNKLFAENIK